MQRRACKSRFGVSFSSAFQLSVRSPNDLMFHVAMSRLRSGIFAGTYLSSTSRNLSSSSLISFGGELVIVDVTSPPRH
jgi:hypothetical protein